MESELITIQVMGRYLPVLNIAHRRGRVLKGLMDTYCRELGITRQQVTFRFDEEEVRDEDTPMSLNIEHEDTIVVSWKRRPGGSHQ